MMLHVDEGPQARPLVNPYFARLARQARLCPECGGVTLWSGTVNPDAAYERCPACGWFDTRLAPESFSGARCAPVGGAGGAPGGAEVLRFRPRG